MTDEPGQANNAGNGPPITADNSAVVPIAFAAAVDWLPGVGPVGQTSRTRSASSASSPPPCRPPASRPTGSSPATCPPTTGRGQGLRRRGHHDLASSTTRPDPNQVAALLGKAYAYIPIALSGTTESFLAGESTLGQNFPINTYNLTPNMVAGLSRPCTSQPTGSVTPPPKPKFALSDNLIDGARPRPRPAVTCAQLVGCPATKTKPSRSPTRSSTTRSTSPTAPAGVLIAPAALGSFNSNVASGSSYQATSWLCSAPNTPFHVTVDDRSGHADHRPR